MSRSIMRKLYHRNVELEKELQVCAHVCKHMCMCVGGWGYHRNTELKKELQVCIACACMCACVCRVEAWEVHIMCVHEWGHELRHCVWH